MCQLFIPLGKEYKPTMTAKKILPQQIRRSFPAPRHVGQMLCVSMRLTTIGQRPWSIPNGQKHKPGREHQGVGPDMPSIASASLCGKPDYLICCDYASVGDGPSVPSPWSKTSSPGANGKANGMRGIPSPGTRDSGQGQRTGRLTRGAEVRHCGHCPLTPSG